MFTLDIVFFVVAGIAVLQAVGTILAVIAARRTKNELNSVVGKVDAVRNSVLARMSELESQTAEKTKASSDALLADLGLAIQNCRDTGTHQTNLRADQANVVLGEVKGHMSQYSAVMESQERLIQAVGALTENLESPVRKHR